MSLLTNLFSITPPTLTPNWCPNPPTWQTIFNKMAEAQVTMLIEEGNFLYNYGPTTPTADNRVYPWLRTTDGLWYVYSGSWRSPHPIPHSSHFRWLWVGTDVELITVDEGDAVNGAFWTIDTNFAGRFPLGVGTLSPSGTAVAVNGTGGADEVALIATDLPSHKHIVPIATYTSHNTDPPGPPASPGTVQYGIGKNLSAGNIPDDSSGTYARALPLTAGADSETPAAQTDVTTLPPYYGVYVIKRTSRVWKLIPG